VSGRLSYNAYLRDWQPPESDEKFLVNILKLSSLWDINVGRRYAISYLDALTLHPARRLELSRMFQVHKWVEPAVRALLQMTFKSLSAENATQIGFHTYIMLCKTKEALEYERKLAVHCVPPMDFVQSYRCISHDKCRRTWKEIWWKRVGKKLLHPDNPLSYSDGPDFVANMDWGSADISPCCKEDMIETVRQAMGFGGDSVEADITKTAVDAVIAFHKSL
jgi:hypothetical protein